MRKGFTLVELLAVIAIISIIAVIATPIITKTIEKSKQDLFQQSMVGLIKTVRQENALAGFTDGERYQISDGRVYPELDYTGNMDGVGVVTIDEDGETELYFYRDGFCAIKEKSDKEVTVEKKKQEGCSIPLYRDFSHANLPILNQGMIPVIYQDGKWVKADLYGRWYDYDERMWANAVTVATGSDTFKIGEEVTDITAFFVWIPRYAYSIPSGLGQREIKIQFVEKNKTVADLPYRMHPAFTFGTEELSGIWVGKFETSGSITAPKIIPNAQLINNQSVNTYFGMGKLIGTMYGLGLDSDSHMIKNTEWDAATYLSTSIYGIYKEDGSCTNKDCKVWSNTNTSSITGCAGDSRNSGASSICNQYHTSLGMNASTTGNIYGIYDMAGGGYELVMTNYNYHAGSGGINLKTIDSKYYNLYTTSNGTTACDGPCYGQAAYEAAWGVHVQLPTSSVNPWVIRGGRYPDPASDIFSFYYDSGSVGGNRSSRIVLVGK